MLNEGIDIDALGAQGRTALHRALGGGHCDVARLLIEQGAMVTVIDALKRTSMHWAAMAPAPAALMACLLILELAPEEALAMLRKQTKSGRSPLHSAAETGISSSVTASSEGQ